jgi:hypothetical protein
VAPRRIKDVAEGRECRRSSSSDYAEVEVGGVAVAGDVDEPECSPTLEDEAASVRWPGLMELGDDVGEDVVPFHDRRVDSVLVGSASHGMAGQHD